MEITYSKAAVKVINGMDRPTKQRIRAAIEKIPEGDIKPLQGSKSRHGQRGGLCGVNLIRATWGGGVFLRLFGIFGQGRKSFQKVFR